MSTHQINLIKYLGYGIWNAINVSIVWVLRTTGIKLNISPEREIISWWTTEIVTIITGLSVTVAFILGLIKLGEWANKKLSSKPHKPKKS